MRGHPSVQGGRVSTNVFVRGLELAEFNALDNRLVEVIADGLPLWHGAQLAIDTTLVSPCAETIQHEEHSGSTLQEARRRKRTYPELAGEAGRARLVVLAAEVGGRWSDETAQILRWLAKARVDSVPSLLQGRVKVACLRRWSSLLACSAARVFAESLLVKRPVPRVVCFRHMRC